MADLLKNKLNQILSENEIILEKRMNIEKTLEKHGSRIEKRLENDNSARGASPSDILNACVEFDPSPNGDFWMWIMNTYIKGGIQRYEDFYKVSEPLTIFMKFRKKIGITDINRIKSYDELRKVTEPYKDEETASQAKKGANEKMFAEKQATLVHDDNKWRVVVPHTKEASCHFGQNTEWCTAASTSHNYFDDYSKTGDLYIILLKEENRRWQFHWEEMQFMDEQDSEINLYEFFSSHKDLLKSVPVFGQRFAFTNEGYKLTIPEKRG